MTLDVTDPKIFFLLEGVSAHARTFLKWRLWKVRTYSDAEVRKHFEAEKAPR